MPIKLIEWGHRRGAHSPMTGGFNMIGKSDMQSGIHPIDFFRWIKFKVGFAKNNPNFFSPCGVVAFVGPQGSGKTLSAVLYVRNLLNSYPNVKLVTNVDIIDYPIVTYEEFRSNVIASLPDEETILDSDIVSRYKAENRIFPFLDNDDIQRYSNGDRGVIYLIDEIQLYLNSLQSKNVNMEVMTEISQQRKQRKHIVCTSQVFGRMAKPLREQFSEVVVCKNYFGFLQCNQLVDRDSLDDNTDSSSTVITGSVKAKFWYFHSPAMYGLYDTYSKIQRGKFVSAEKKVGDIYDNRLSICDRTIGSNN